MTFHDFIPIYVAHTCDHNTAVVWKEFADQMLRLTDVALCVSKNTENDLKRYCRETSCPAPFSIVTRLGSGFQVAATRQAPKRTKHVSEPYALFVGTIEGRKNHKYIFHVWRNLLQRGLAVPKLVCVGRLGWQSEGFIQNLVETDCLDGKVEVREDVSDAELMALYRDSLFTVFPSLYEGWGLPVSESLASGKTCILTPNSSLPEVAGDLGIYIPSDDEDGAADIIARWLRNPGDLAKHDEKIRQQFRPTSWKEVAEVIVKACSDARSRSPEAASPIIELAKEYPVRQLRVPGKLDGKTALEAFRAAHAGVILDATARTPQKVVGLLSRNMNWHQAEDWGSWSRGARAGLQISLNAGALKDCRSIVVYAALRIADAAIASKLRLSCCGAPLSNEVKLTETETIGVWSIRSSDLLNRGTIGADGTLQVDLDFELCRRGHGEDDPSQPREAFERMFGLRSFVLLDSSDVERRLEIAEKSQFRVAAS
jgi:hypothetical protein